MKNSPLLPNCGFCLWLTGLSGAGKSTLLRAISEQLHRSNIRHESFDADEVRKHISSGLGYSLEDRIQNVDRISYLASLPVKYGGISLVGCISPLQTMRDQARERISAFGTFIEIFVNAPLAVCEERDPKGLYKKARAGEVLDFTGISSPYESPLDPELTILTAGNDVDTCSKLVLEYLIFRGLLRQNSPRALFIGRWQPFHKGHDYIIRQQLDSGVPVAIGVRDTPLSDLRKNIKLPARCGSSVGGRNSSLNKILLGLTRFEEMFGELPIEGVRCQ